VNLETFFEKFELFAGAPDAVTRMRELIIETAIRGQLVPQNAGEAPAEALLEQLENSRTSTPPLGKGRRQEPLPGVGTEAYFEIPPDWVWTRLGNTGSIFSGDSVSEAGKAELAKVEFGLPFIATKDVGYGRAPLDYDNGLKVRVGDPRFRVAHANAVLICAEGGSAGRKIGIADRDICFGNKLYANEVLKGVHHRYVFYFYQAPTFFRAFSARMTGIIGGISRSEFLSLPIPLPSTEEQVRLVAKIDELMALCDRLESEQREQEAKLARLTRASLARFAVSPTESNLDFILEPTLAVPPSELRKSILTLAVQGRLVEQDMSDEPGVALLRRIGAGTSTQSVGSGHAEIGDTEKLPFDLPDGWSMARVGSILKPTRGISYGVIKLGPEPQTGGVFILRCSNVRFRKIDLHGIRKITEQLSVEYGRTILEGGEVLINVRGTLGGCAVVPPELKGFNIAREVAVIPVHPEICSEFVLNVIASPYFQDRVEENLRGIAYEGLNLGLLRDFLVPIPPLAEQRRIVERVSELMALVDKMEVQLSIAHTTAANLLAAAVRELTNESERHGITKV
jgi:type I restriction enzyme, S subunit